MFGLLKSEISIIQKLNTPVKIQDFLETIPENMEIDGEETCLSPRRVLRERRAHCIEGAMLACVALWYHGESPLLMDFEAADYDEDHVIVPFRRYGRWGAISKTNHHMLRYRDPVYRTIGELAMSYFHEYFSNDGRKSLRTYTPKPFNLKTIKDRRWITSEESVWVIPEILMKQKHVKILPQGFRSPRRSDPIQIKAGNIAQWGPHQKKIGI